MRGHIRRRGTRSWAVVVDLGRGPDGKRQQRWHSVKGSRADAEGALVRLLRSLQTGEYVEPSKLTVKFYLERWLADYAKPNTSGKTYERYSEIVNANLMPALGHHKLTKLQPLHIQAVYTEALKRGRRSGKGGLSPRTVLHIHRVLHQALNQAVRWQLLIRNPASAVEPPRPQSTEMQVLTETQTARMLALAGGTDLYVPILLAVTTGMRRGEILALTWQDFDPKSGHLTVTKSLEQTKEGLTVKAPKTAKGRRTIPLPAITVQALKRHKAEQGRRRLRLGGLYQELGLICAGSSGSHQEPDSFSQRFQIFLKRTDLPRIRLHDLRHTHATQLLKQGVHPKVVAERLGHSSITITLDTYSHVVPGLQEDAARQLDRVLKKAIRETEAN
jgi:integrase